MLAVVQRTGSPDQQLTELLFGVIYTAGAVFVLSVSVRLIFDFICSNARRPKPARFQAEPIESLPTIPSAVNLLANPQSPSFLLERLRCIDWFQFENLVAAIYRKLGYRVTRRGGANPDGGIDVIIEKEGLKIAVQCKQWKAWDVGVRPIREFLGALTDAGLTKGIFITLCGYTGPAKELADKHQIEILNETGLQSLLESVNARFDPDILAILNDTTKYCPKCEEVMVLRTGANSGSHFWGCSNFPRCRGKIPVS